MIGKENKNLIKSSSNDTNSDSELYTYDVNGNGYVTHFTFAVMDDDELDVFENTLIYTCK